MGRHVNSRYLRLGYFDCSATGSVGHIYHRHVHKSKSLEKSKRHITNKQTNSVIGSQKGSHIVQYLMLIIDSDEPRGIRNVGGMVGGLKKILYSVKQSLFF